MSTHDVIVVGAGPAGLSAGLALADNGIRALIVERADSVGSSWRNRYDRLRLNSPHRLSRLPGRRFPRGTPTFPSRDDYVAYLESNADGGFDVRFGTEVERVSRSGESWMVETADEALLTRQVVVATGYDHTPVIPDWPGRDSFTGELIHAAAYRNPERYVGRTVLVVGPGCSGMEIAYDLATGGAEHVWLAARTPPNIALRTGPGGLPGDYIALPLMRLPTALADRFERVGRKADLGDLSPWGLPVPEEGTFARLKRLGVAPAIVDREVIEAVKQRVFEVVRGVTAIEGAEVILDDGSRLQPDAIISATGYRRNLEPMVGHLGVLGADGLPARRGAEAALPGLRFLGYQFRPAHLGNTSKHARRVAKAIAGELKVSRLSRMPS